MNPDTVNLIERPYQEVIDDILTALVGGVVNEPIIFDVKTDLYALAEPAQDVRGITGKTRREIDGESTVDPVSFQKDIDFRYDPDLNAVIWDLGGALPDDESVFFVDYFRQESESPLTDINVGSVTRTVCEAVGREISTVYQQINQAYRSGFIDSAEATALDLVVSILNVTRKTKDFAVGLVTFFRDPQSDGNITIPDGTLLGSNKGDVLFETTGLRTLQRGQVRIDVPVRATEDFRGEAGIVDAASITQMSQPIEGIERITNFDATLLAAEDESDIQLRARARSVLRSLGKGTLAALARVIFEGRGELLEIWDPAGPPARRTDPGQVLMLVSAEPERFGSLQGAVHETRAAGIDVRLVARYVFFKPRMVVSVTPGLTSAGKEKVQLEVISALQAYVDGLGSGDAADGTDMLDAIKATPDVNDATIVDVIAWRSDVAQPDSDILVEQLVTLFDASTQGDSESFRNDVTELLEEEGTLVPDGGRIPDRSLVRSTEEDRQASDAEIEEGKFEVVPVVDGENWWVVLDIEAADIAVEEAGS